MATWQEAKGFIAANYNFEDLGDDILKFVFNTGDGRSQLIYISHLDSIPAIRYFSPFATASDISAEQLVNIAETSLFGLSRIADMYCVMHITPLADLDASEIEWPLTYVSFWADAIEKKLGLGDKM